MGVFDHYGRGNFEIYYPDGTRRYALPKKMNYSAALGRNKVIYYIYKDGKTGILYAFQGDQPLANSGWPRFKGGNKNSGNASVK